MKSNTNKSLSAKSRHFCLLPIRNRSEVRHTYFNLYHYAGNNPVRYIDPDGRFDFFADSIKGFSVWFSAIWNPTDLTSLNKVTNFMNETPEFWGVIAGVGCSIGTGCGFYFLCPSVKSDIDDFSNRCVDVYDNLLNFGFDILSMSYTYNIDDTTKFNIKFENFSLSNLGMDLLYEKVLFKINESRGNMLKFNTNINISNIKKENNITFGILFSFNEKYKEKNYEQIVPSYVF